MIIKNSLNLPGKVAHTHTGPPEASPTRLPDTTAARKLRLSPASQFSHMGGMFSVMVTQQPGIFSAPSLAYIQRTKCNLIAEDVTHHHLTALLGSLEDLGSLSFSLSLSLSLLYFISFCESDMFYSVFC